MLRGFGNFLIKELKELIRDPKILLGMIIVPLVMFPVLGGIMSFSVKSAQENAGKMTMLVINHDGGQGSTVFMSNLSQTITIYNVTASNVTDAIPLMPEYNATMIMEIPAAFSQNVANNTPVEVKIYSVFAGVSMFESMGSSLIDGLIANYNRDLAPNVVRTNKSVIIKGELFENVDPMQLSGLMLSQAIAMPITIMILLSYSMQIAATSVAMEKEEKTLETLLTLPMDRFAILAGKLSGSVIIAGVGALAYMFGFNYYMGSLTSIGTSGAGLDLAKLGLVPSLFGYLLLGVSLFVTLLSALALAVILSAFAEDVRGAQSLVGYVYPFLFVPSLALMYVDFNTLPFVLKAVLFAIPFSQPIIASKSVIMGDYLTAGLGIAYVAAFTLAIMYVASRLFATEKILTAKLRFKGLRDRRKVPVESSE